jgi:adenylate cyclase
MSKNCPCILLVDDDPANLFLLTELLRLNGYHVLSASSGTEAIEIANHTPIDLIILDVMMPEMDGFEVCKILRQNLRLLSIPILFLTALDDEESHLKALEMMAEAYLIKPVNRRLFVAKVENSLRLQKQRLELLATEVRQQVKQQIKEQIYSAWQISEALSEKFRLFVPEQFLQRIAPQGVDSIQLGNVTEEEMTILFCDIRDFTAIAESQIVSKTFEWLNVFFSQMSDCITTHKGFIDKFLGDAILAIFTQSESHAEDAINAAIMMQESLQYFNENRQQFNLKDPLKIGIGIHKGIGMIGTLGSHQRMDSTVIGDVVNTASRLERLTKIYGCPIIASKAVISSLKNTDLLYNYREIDRVNPRGKQQTIEIYEVFACHALNGLIKSETLSTFQKGIQAWQNQKYLSALGYFQEVITKNPTDSVALIYHKKCQEQLLY